MFGKKQSSGIQANSCTSKSVISIVFLDMFLGYFILLQCVPRKWFGSADCVQRDKSILYTVSQLIRIIFGGWSVPP